MTFGQYIDNPMGKSNAVFSARDSYRVKYTEKFDAIYTREAGKIDRVLYHDKSHDAYFAHFKMPSETVKGFYYDVVIRFYTKDNAEKINGSLKNYEVQFFSNDPAFIYTYLYVFHKHGMLIEDLTSKCPKASLTQRPEARNAYEVPGYVKSIYFAYILMSRTDLFLKSTYDNFGKRYSKSALLNSVMNGENKMEERREKEAKQKAIEKKQKASTPKPSKTEIDRHSKTTKPAKPISVIKPKQPKAHVGTGNIKKVSTITRSSGKKAK